MSVIIVRFIIYYSDGVASQYENFTKLINLCQPQTDFHIPAEYLFFATFDGECPCDGVRGAAVCLASRASQQVTISDYILTPHDYSYGANKINQA